MFLGESPKSHTNFVAKTMLKIEKFKLGSLKKIEKKSMTRSWASTLGYTTQFFNVELKRADLIQQTKYDKGIIFQL